MAQQNKISSIFLPEMEMLLDKESAYVKPLYDDGIERGYSEKHYFQIGDKNVLTVVSDNNREDLKKAWIIAAKTIANIDIAKEEYSPAPKEEITVSFKKCSSEVLRKILNE